MGVIQCCRCPEAWQDYVNRWVWVYTTNDTDEFGGTQWQLLQVQDKFIVLRRQQPDPVGVQRAVVLCSQIIGMTEAPQPI